MPPKPRASIEQEELISCPIILNGHSTLNNYVPLLSAEKVALIRLKGGIVKLLGSGSSCSSSVYYIPNRTVVGMTI